MTASKRALIYGAGMSGMVAAFNLASRGWSVLVREKEDGFGGSSDFNPSTHTTPLDVGATSEYINIDVSGAFHHVSSVSLYLHDHRIEAPAAMTYHVERSSRPQSLDRLLYDRCLEAGVEFEFSRPLQQGEVETLPAGTIIACGLNPSAYHYLDIPCERWFAWMARGEKEFHNYAWIWMDECINEYGYTSFCNGIYYNLLFSFGREVDREALERYRGFMRRVEGMEEENWEYVHGVVPVFTPDKPRLFRNGLVMCGTMSGCIDPFMGFGISGALVSGRVAAMALEDPDGALCEHERFTRNFSRVLQFKREIWHRLRERVDLMEDVAKILGSERTVALIVTGIMHGRKNSAIPGFGPLNTH